MTKDASGSIDQAIVGSSVTRRSMGVGLLAMLAGGLGLAKQALAFDSAADGSFNAASNILGRYGVTVRGAAAPAGHDVMVVETNLTPGTEYEHLFGSLDEVGEIVPCARTSVMDDDATFEHFHPGTAVAGITPCTRTTIEGPLTTFELFDPNVGGGGGGIAPCCRVTAEMLSGGGLGQIDVTIDPALEDTRILIGADVYVLSGGVLVPPPPPAP